MYCPLCIVIYVCMKQIEGRKNHLKVVVSVVVWLVIKCGPIQFAWSSEFEVRPNPIAGLIGPWNASKKCRFNYPKMGLIKLLLTFCPPCLDYLLERPKHGLDRHFIHESVGKCDVIMQNYRLIKYHIKTIDDWLSKLLLIVSVKLCGDQC